jgi:hypothetical protein
MSQYRLDQDLLFDAQGPTQTGPINGKLRSQYQTGGRSLSVQMGDTSALYYWRRYKRSHQIAAKVFAQLTYSL